MTLFLTRAGLAAWLFLVAATILTFWLAEGAAPRTAWAVPLVLLIAAVKAWVILRHYMELKHAPRAWRLVFELWVIIVTTIVLGFWWSAGVA